jgi:uncharacterized protein YecT (DUF1311 family)
MPAILQTIAAVLALMPLVSIATPPCEAAKSVEDLALCFSKEIETADLKLDRYLEAARTRISSQPELTIRLSATQAAWMKYRQKHCGNVYDYWTTGLARYRKSAECQLELTRERTHDIWSAYLTHEDSAPPLLPEP